MNRVLAASEPETVLRSRDAMRLFDRAVSGPTLISTTALARELAALVPSCLDIDRRRAMERICCNMEATEDLFDETYRIARKFAVATENDQRMSLAQRFLEEYEDAIANLGRTVEMCDLYFKGEYSTVLTK